jgi:hypothetical protein
MEQRAWIKGKKMEKMRIVIVGGSQMGRMRYEIVRMDNSSVDVEKVERMRGEVTDEEVGKARAELVVMESYPEAIVVGGPGNSLISHGKPDSRGLKPERTVRVKRADVKGAQEKWE